MDPINGLPRDVHAGWIRAHEEDYTPYDFDRVRGSARTNSIHEQLDLLYRYAQYELRRADPHCRWLTLYRGTYDAREHEITERSSRREYYVRLNNLSSFTSDPERAWEFGTTVWSMAIPACKIFFYGDLLPQSLLKGENEYLVIGGEYRAKEMS
jgi:NAD+--dinitrogen-reductase ADP-D-ribosyltransferase